MSKVSKNTAYCVWQLSIGVGFGVVDVGIWVVGVGIVEPEVW